jgi:signal transduction histidine kinase
VEELLDMIASGAGNLAEIFERVRQSVRYENVARYRLMEDTFDFRKWLDNLVLSMLPLFMEKGISLVKHIPEDFPSQIYADRVYLSQVVNNLLVNALKYSPPLTAVSITCFKGDGMFGIEITDQGIGIPAKKLPFIFEEYSRMSGDIRTKFGGIGLGLSIAQNLAALMGGRIEVKSREKEGSTFTVIMPVHGMSAS